MNAQTAIKQPIERLREPFSANQISKLPKETKAQIEARRNDKNLMVWKCDICGGAHHKNAVHLDYVGHAALTDRLLDTDLEWSWEPVAFNSDGLPALDRNGGLWIKLTVCGVSRLGYGAADGKSGGDAVKEIIGDALRNAAMRFGAALDLWHKGDLHAEEPEAEPAKPVADLVPAKRQPRKLDGPYTSPTALWAAVKGFDREVRACGDIDSLEAYLVTADAKAIWDQCKRDEPQLLYGGDKMPPEFMPLDRLVASFRAELKDPADWRANPTLAG